MVHKLANKKSARKHDSLKRRDLLRKNTDARVIHGNKREAAVRVQTNILPDDLAHITRTSSPSMQLHDVVFKTNLRAFFVIGAIAGLAAVGFMLLLERFVFNIIDVCVFLGFDQKVVLLPLYSVPLVIPDVIDMFLGMAGISTGLVGRIALVFLFNMSVYGSIVVVYLRWGKRRPKIFWGVLLAIVILVLSSIYWFLW